MATEFEITLVRNIDRNSLLSAISEREDVVEVMQMFRDCKDYAPREYMNIKDFAKYIGASEKYVRDLAKYAELNSCFAITKVGREYRLDRYTYEKWISMGGRY